MVEIGRSPADAGSGCQPSASTASAGATAFSQSGIPNAICGYPLPGWRLDQVSFDKREGQPDGWIVSLKRESPDWHLNRREICVMTRSDLGALEAWDEALKVAIRSDEREAAREREREARASNPTPPSDGDEK